MALTSGSAASTAQVIQLRWSDRCSVCDRHLPEGTAVHWVPRGRLVVCASCAQAGLVDTELMPSIWAADQPDATSLDLHLELAEPSTANRDSETAIEFHWIPTDAIDEHDLGTTLGTLSFTDVAAGLEDYTIDTNDPAGFHLAS